MPWPRPWGQAEYFPTGSLGGELSATSPLSLRVPLYR